MFLFALYLAFFAMTGADWQSNLNDFLSLFNSQRLVHVSTLDFMLLSIAMADPLGEDMARRGVEGSPLKYALLPVFGPLLYLLTRPGLERDEE